MCNNLRVQLLPVCKVVHQNNIAGIEINGTNHGVMNAYVAFHDQRTESPNGVVALNLNEANERLFGFDSIAIRKMYRSGVRIFMLLWKPFLYWNEDDFFDSATFLHDLNEVVMNLKKYAPDSYFIIRWRLFVPEWWSHVYPDEVIRYSDGSQSAIGVAHASYASSIWRKRAGEILEEALETIINSELVYNFAGIHLAYGNCGEWNNFGYHESKFPDFSYSMEKAFHDWGGNGIPSVQERLNNRHKTLRTLPDEHNIVEFYRFWQEFTVDTILYFAHIVRTATAGRSIVGSFYGYYIGHLSHFAGPYHFQDSGHYAVSRLIDSPDIDFLAGPYDYRDRLANCVPQSAYTSIQLHNKLWYSENDQRTHLSGERNLIYGTTKNLSETVAIVKRDFSCNLTKGCAYYFFDFVKSWYREPEFYSTLIHCKNIENFLRVSKTAFSPEVAVFFSEETVPYMGNGKNGVIEALAQMMQKELDMAGAPYAFYTMNDIESADLSRCKIAIFLNAYYLPDIQRRAIEEKVFGNNRTVVFLHSAACVTDEGTSVSEAVAWLGIEFEQMEHVVVDQVQLLEQPDDCHKFSEYIDRIFSVIDADAIPLASYANTQYIAGAEKNKTDYRLIYWGMPSLNAIELRMLYSRSGVHLYACAELATYAYGQFACLYSRKAQKANLHFPESGEIIFDLMTGEVLARNADNVELEFCDETDSRLCYAGSIDEWENYISNYFYE